MAESTQRKSLSNALNSHVRHYGKAIISNLAIAVRTTRLFSFDHQNVKEAVRELVEFLESFIRLEGEVNLARSDDFLFLNEVPIRVDLGGVQTYQYTLDLYAERGLGSLEFQEGVTTEEISRLIEAFNQEPDDPAKPWDSFRRMLDEMALEHIAATRYDPRREEKHEFSEDRRNIVISTYFRTISLMADGLAALRAGKRLNLKRMKRAVQSMVDMLLEDEGTLLALVNIKDYLSRLANHSVNTAVLSMALGIKLGLPKKHLSDLGVAALLHDAGKIRLSDKLLDASRSLSDEEVATLRGHVYDGVETLLTQRIVDAVVKSMNVCFLHHFRYDGTGYPRTQVVEKQNLYSRIVAVADFYDNRTASKAGDDEQCPADRILRAMLDGGGTEYDPLVVKAFVNLLGLYPVGTIVYLDTGEIATVTAPPTNQRYLDRPTVRILSEGEGAPGDVTVNLLDKDSSGNFKRNILKIYQQQEVRLEMEEYLSVI